MQMKDILRKFIKVLYVVIIPIMAIWSASWYYVVMGPDSHAFLVVCMVAVLACLSSFLCTIYMNKVNVLPKTTFEFVPMIGFAIGIDNVSYKNKSVVILLPFILIEFQNRK